MTGETSPTPLLYRQAPLPRPASPVAGSRWLVAGLVVLLGAVVVALIFLETPIARAGVTRVASHLRALERRHGTAVGLLLAGGSIAVATFACVFVHEAGHVLAGLAAGFRFQSIAVGPIRLERGFRIALHRGALAWSGGWVGMLPAKRDRLRGRAVILVAAGPVASLLCALAVVVAPFQKGLGSDVFVLACFLGGAIELLPIRGRDVAFDGWRILQLLRDQGWSERWLSLMRLSAAIQEGVTPEDLPVRDLAGVQAFRDGSAETVLAHGLAFFAAFHRRDDAEAARALETCLGFSGHAPSPLRAAVMSDAAVFLARRRNRPDMAQLWLEEIPAGAAPWLRTRVEAAVLETRGDGKGAARKLDDYEATLRTLPLPTEAQRDMLLRLLGRWRSELAS